MEQPRFLCIGVPKAGTTWLFDNLTNHPEVWLLPYKSAQYFSGLAKAARYNKLKRMPGKIIRGGLFESPFWHLNYFLNPKINDSWYRRLFAPGARKGLVTGDISPSYSTLDESTVQRVKLLIPDAKIILFLRNPIDRNWSHAKLHFLTPQNLGMDISDVSKENLMEFVDSIAQESRSNQINIMDRWIRHFGEKNVMINFFEVISEDPLTLLKKICSHLGISYNSDFFSGTYARNIFKGPEEQIPHWLGMHLAEKYLDEIKAINERFGGHSDRWLIQANEYLK